jgi:hypothetical protein
MIVRASAPGTTRRAAMHPLPVTLPDRGGMLLSRSCRTRPGVQSQPTMRRKAIRHGGTPCRMTRLAPGPGRLARIRLTTPRNATPARQA